MLCFVAPVSFDMRSSATFWLSVSVIESLGISLPLLLVTMMLLYTIMHQYAPNRCNVVYSWRQNGLLSAWTKGMCSKTEQLQVKGVKRESAHIHVRMEG